MKRIDDYYDIVGDQVIAGLHKKARKLYGKHILHVNSTRQGGGVAEMLNSYIPLWNDLGIDTGWRILPGDPDFFTITKKFHNGLQGEAINLSEIKRELYEQANEMFAVYTHIDHDCVIIHDPQPLPLIEYYKKRQPWIWRCHVDLSHPNRELWDYLKRFMLRYYFIIISNEEYRRNDLPIDQNIIYPAIDPLSPKNKDLPESDIHKYLDKFDIPTDKPLITQISRFDKWKDPMGVIEVFKKVRESVDCRLILCGNMATDDPEGWEIFTQVNEENKDLIDDRQLILLTVDNNILVNVLQRVSDVIVQKSLREGFGLTVTEALWKGTPVVASNIGGIPYQITDGETGYLHDPNDKEAFAARITEILRNKKLKDKLGVKAKEYVRQRFLITRILSDYMDLLGDLFK
ncbi:glycosyltransferase [bacterium]|nr:glycosyltransferase [bacterium]